MLYPVGFADHVEVHWPGIDHVPNPRLFSELDAIVGYDGVDLARHGLKHVLQKLPGRPSVSRCNELSDDELGRSINAYEELELPFSCLCTSAISMWKNPMG